MGGEWGGGAGRWVGMQERGTAYWILYTWDALNIYRGHHISLLQHQCYNVNCIYVLNEHIASVHAYIHVSTMATQWTDQSWPLKEQVHMTFVNMQLLHNYKLLSKKSTKGLRIVKVPVWFLGKARSLCTMTAAGLTVHTHTAHVGVLRK